jgi:fructose-specific phosphotransferase system IIC component
MKKTFSDLKKHLLTGTSHMIPFIVAGGVLLSLAVMLSGKGAVPDSGILKDISDMGIAGLTLFTIVLGGYIAYSIADRPGLAPGMIGTWIAVNNYKTGFIGAIIVGFLAGYVVNMLKKIKLPSNMRSLSTIFIFPLFGTFIVCGVVMWVIGTPIAAMMNFLNTWLNSMQDSGKVLLGTILGGMTAFDMGGPINKVATLFAQTQVGEHPWLMGGVGVAICTPPIGMGLATFLAPKKYSSEEQEAGKAALLMGMIGISEGAIPFAAADPLRVLPSIVVGGIIGNVIGFLMGVLNHAPWGGWIVLPVVEGKMFYIIATLAGSFATAIMVNLLKKEKVEDDKEDLIEEDVEEANLELEFDMS